MSWTRGLPQQIHADVTPRRRVLRGWATMRGSRRPTRTNVPFAPADERVHRRTAAPSRRSAGLPRRQFLSRCSLSASGNPKGEARLPAPHTIRGNWHFTVLHSNMARAHDLGRVWDWVVAYFHDHDRGGAQRTIVTETGGPLIGQRVVHGRERDCMAYHETAR